MHPVIPVRSVCTGVCDSRNIIYIYTLLNVPLLEENPIRFKYIDRFNARTQILDVVVLNYQMLLFG